MQLRGRSSRERNGRPPPRTRRLTPTMKSAWTSGPQTYERGCSLSQGRRYLIGRCRPTRLAVALTRKTYAMIRLGVSYCARAAYANNPCHTAVNPRSKVPRVQVTKPQVKMNCCHPPSTTSLVRWRTLRRRLCDSLAEKQWLPLNNFDFAVALCSS